jgi:hypothetical protein
LTPNENTGNRRLLELLRGGCDPPRVYPLSDLPAAMEAAATAGNLERIVGDPALVSHLGIAAAFLLPPRQLFG